MKRSSILSVFVVALWVMAFYGSAMAADEPAKKRPRLQPYQVELEKALGAFFKFLGSLDQNKDLGREEKERKAIAFARKFRFGREKRDALFLAGLNGRLIMDPYQPHLNGRNLLNWRDPNGQPTFKMMIDMLKADGEGFITYLWPKYGGDKPVPTVAFLKVYKPFGWFAGATMPISTIEGFRAPTYGGAFVSLITVDIDNSPASGTGANP